MNKQDKFYKAIENNNIELVKELLSQVDPSIHINYAIRIAARNGHLEVIYLLLNHPKVKFDEVKRYLSIEVINYYKTKIAEELLLKD